MCILNDEKWLAGIIGLIGALIGGAATLAATRWAHRLDHEKSKQEKNDEIKALLQGIKDETTTLYEIYMESVGNSLEKNSDGEPFDYYFIVQQDYFSVYSSNADKIGRIENTDLRKAIIRTYSIVRSLVDTYNMNNQLVRSYEQNNRLYQITSSGVYNDIAQADMQGMIEYASSLREKHNSFVNSYDKLKELLDEHFT